MFTLASVLEFFTKPKNWLYIGLTVLVLVGGYKTYNFIYDRGAAHQLLVDTATIKAAQKERDSAVTARDTYIASYNRWVADTKAAQADAVAKQAVDKAASDKILAEAKTNLANKEKTINELRNLVNQDLGNIRLPGSVVRLWNLSLEGSATDASELGTALAGSSIGADTAQTDVTLFDLLEAGLYNNSEAVQRGIIIERWQSYYSSNQKIFHDHEKTLKESAPKE